jgi:hypothetical protein
MKIRGLVTGTDTRQYSSLDGRKTVRIIIQKP